MDYNHANAYFDSRYPRRLNRSSRGLQDCRDYDDDPESFSPTPKSEESDIEQEQNDENIYHRSPIRTRQRRILIEDDEEMDNELIENGQEFPRQKGRARTSSTSQKPNELEINGTLQEEEDDELGTSIYERIKRRRQMQTLDEGPPPKRSYTTPNGTTKREENLSESEEEEEPTGRRYFFRQNRAKVERLQDEYAALNNKNRHGRRSVHFRRDHSSHRSRRSSRRHRRRRDSNSGFSSVSSSTSDSDLADAEKDFRAELKFEKRKLRSLQKGRARFLPMNMTSKEWDQKMGLNQLTSRHTIDGLSGSGDIEPMGIDKAATFDKIGGLDEHIQSLKEAVVFPLLYPDLFEK